MRALPLLLLLSLPAVAAAPGETVFALDAVASKRFPDAEDAGPSFVMGDQLTVLVVEGERLRVVSTAGGIGWIDAARVAPLGELPPEVRDVVVQKLLESTRAPGGRGLPLPASLGD
jgi:hypothetical protein